MTQINKELDSERKREKRRLEDSIKKVKSQSEKNEYERVLNGLKKSKYALLKNESDLNEEQKMKLAQVKEVSPSLKEMHELKEKIRIIFNEIDDWLAGLFQIGMWLSKAKKYFPVSQKTIIRWPDVVIAYFDNGTSSGVVEGINNKEGGSEGERERGRGDPIQLLAPYRRWGFIPSCFDDKLKLIKRLGYGFRNFENFRARCLLNWNFTY